MPDNVYHSISEIYMPTPHVLGMAGIWNLHALQLVQVVQGSW